MRNKYLILLFLAATLVTGVWTSCKDEFLEQSPIGSYSEPQLESAEGLDGILINAYATIDGLPRTWATGAHNWLWGSIRSEEAYKGSETSDQPLMTVIEKHGVLPSFGDVANKWNGIYDGIGQANAALKAIKKAEPNLLPADFLRLQGEARFIRGHHLFEGQKLFGKISYVDENATDFFVPNEGDVWEEIEADFQFGYTNLPAQQSAKGKANKWAAASYLAKAYMFQGKFDLAEPLLDEIILNGTNSSGVKYALNDKFHDAFRTSNENSAEDVFSIQYTVGLGTVGGNGNFDNILNNPHNGQTALGCCGFFQPSHYLVNAFKVDGSGLPVADFNATDFVDATKFRPVYTGPVDPRLDWTVGRVGVEFLGWGAMTPAYIRNLDFGGPYVNKKNQLYKDEETKKEAGEWGSNLSPVNFTIIRFADVLLWKAEAAIENGDWAGDGLDYINMVRNRAKNPENLDGIDYADSVTVSTTFKFDMVENPRSVEPYASFASQDAARTALRHERLLELSMEGHRYFDLVRWDIVDEVVPAYLAAEIPRESHLVGAVWDECDRYLPIPESAIANSFKDGAPTLTQRSGCY